MYPSSSTKRKSFPNGKNTLQFSSKQFSVQPYVPLYRNLTVSLRSCSLPLTSAMIPVKLLPRQNHLQKIKSACWCVVCRAFTCLTDTEGEGRVKGGEKERERGNLLPSCSTLIMTDFLGFALKISTGVQPVH